MSGRQAHGRSLLEKPASRKKNNQRGGGPGRPSGAKKNGRIDVLALAEKQIGETKSKGVRLRDLDIERDPSKRRRGNEDGDEEEDKDDAGRAGGASKRRRRNDEEEGAGGDDQADDNSDDEMQSDSDGNEWHVGVGSDDDDSEIDSDEAFGESDDEMFDGYAFRGSSSSTKNKKKKRSNGGKGGEDKFGGFDDSDSDSDAGDDGDSLGEDAIDLAQALDQVSSDEDDEEEEKKSARTKQKKKKSIGEGDGSDESDESDDSGLSAEDSGSLDSEDDDDDDDESGSESESESPAASDEEDEDSDASDGSRFEELKSMASAFAGKSKDADTAAGAGAAQSKVSLDDLGLFGVKDAQIKKSLKLLAKEEKGESGPSKKLDVPLARIHQDRILREAAAEKSHETLGRWVDTVKHNRRAEHLSFPIAGSLKETGLDSLEIRPIGQKTAKTELEKTILSIMEESGLGPSQKSEKKGGSDGEGEDGKKALSAEELKQIASQRRHQRELQSREQARARRIKKIKSKTYRRIHRREKARNEAATAELEEGEDVDSEEEREAQHRRRAMERMGSRHRESKWAKQAKNTGRAAWDDDFRSGLVDMARRDEELRRRVERRASGDEKDSDESSSDEDEDEDDETFRKRALRQLKKAGQDGDSEPQSALVNIAFMQKAELARKKANDEAVAEIMRDLDAADHSGEEAVGAEDEDEDGEGSAWTTVGRRMYGVAGAGQTSGKAAKTKSAAARARTAAAADEPADEQGAVTSETAKTGSWGALGGGSFREDTTAAQGGPAATDKADSWSKSKESTSTKGGRRAAKVEETLPMSSVIAGTISSMDKKKDDEAGRKAGSKKLEKPKTKKKQTAVEDDSETSSSGSSSEDEGEDEDRQDSAGVRTGARGGGRGGQARSLSLRDANLLNKAIGDDDTAAEFAREKARVAAEEAEAAEAEADGGRKRGGGDFLPGWGSWAGDGISKRSAKRDQKRLEGQQQQQQQQQQGGRGGRDGAKDGKAVVKRRDEKLERVIISERRVQKNAKYLASQLPHEFETKNQYERSLRLPVGPEWGTKTAFQDSIKPRLLVKQGVVLPMARPLM